MRGQCWWKGGPENELAFALGAVKLGPFKFGKDKNEVKTYRFFVNDGQVRWGAGEGNRHEISGGEQTPWNVLCRYKPTSFHIARREMVFEGRCSICMQVFEMISVVTG